MLNQKLQHIHDTWFLDATIEELQKRIDKGELSSKELVLLYFDRIARLDGKLKSILEVNPDALQLADALDYERITRGKRGMLHGIPVLLKDNIDTGDKLHTSAGSLLLKDSYAKKDAFLVKKLRNAGAIILGKANMSEWSFFMSLYGIPNGYSSRGGQVLNPYGPERFDVGGSSSGSAAAVAAHLATVAVGTETSGSILNPASQNSLVGIKPTVGLISRSGLIPISHTQDTAGSMARTVKDAVILLACMVGADEDDPVTSANPTSSEILLAALERASLLGVRLGVVRANYFTLLPEDKRDVVEKAIGQLRDGGAVIVDDLAIPSAREKWSIDVLLYEFKVNLNAYLSKLNPPLTLQDIITMNKANSKRMLRYGQSLLEKAEKTSGTLTEPSYLDALAFDQFHSTENGIDALLEGYDLDAIVFPHFTGAPIAAKAGYPSVTVPAGYTDEGEPVGVTFTGTRFQEAKLIQIASAFENVTNSRRNPTLSFPSNC